MLDPGEIPFCGRAVDFSYDRRLKAGAKSADPDRVLAWLASFSPFFAACLPLFFADALTRTRAKGLSGALALRVQRSRKYRA